jgi:hypothetical protein
MRHVASDGRDRPELNRQKRRRTYTSAHEPQPVMATTAALQVPVVICFAIPMSDGPVLARNAEGGSVDTACLMFGAIEHNYQWRSTT